MVTDYISYDNDWHSNAPKYIYIYTHTHTHIYIYIYIYIYIIIEVQYLSVVHVLNYA